MRAIVVEGGSHICSRRILWITFGESYKLLFIMLQYVLLLFLSSGLGSSSDCPMDCSCQIPRSIFCSHRQSTIVPHVPTTIQNLYIFQNGIVSLSQDDFKGLVELELLDMSQNKLTEIPDGVFEMLSKLKNLDLSFNQITHISKGSFSGLVQLERLYLHSNRIHSIHSEAFKGLTMLLELKLQGNLLTAVPSLRFPSLLLLDLSYNNIPILEASDLQTPHLEALKVASLGLISLEEDLIGSMKNLHELDLSSNQLDEVPQALKQDSLKGLTKLSLAANPLGELRVEDFRKLTELQELDLSSLNLQGFPQSFFQGFPNLKQLTAAENPFNCLCPLAWFPVWLTEKTVTLGRREETRCHFPLVNAGKMLSALEQKDFGCPPTTTVKIGSPTGSTPVPQMVNTSPETHTKSIPPPPLPGEEAITSKTDSDPLSPELPVSPSSTSGENEPFCPPNICLNGGTCNFDPLGQITCLCPSGTSGFYCENVDEVPEPPKPSATEVSIVVPEIHDKLDAISSRQVTSTSILVDLHRFIETRPHILGIRLTYRNLSGPDRRPIKLSVPASYLEYTLRGLRPNCTYLICASPFSERINSWANSSVEMGSCTEARTAGSPMTSSEPLVETKSSVTYTLISALSALALVLGLAVVAGTIICLRKRQANSGMELELGAADPELVEQEGIKACLDNGGNGVLPLKEPEIDHCHMSLPPSLLQQNGGSDCDAPLMQGHCPSNNNLATIKPSYF
ncbi:vasorin-like [Pholidichthys leucotaenia]